MYQEEERSVKSVSKERLNRSRSRSVDGKRGIENLHNYNKNKKYRIEELKKEIDKENGITFKPKINTSSSTRYRSNTRGNSRIEEGKNNINEEQHSLIEGNSIIRDIKNPTKFPNTLEITSKQSSNFTIKPNQKLLSEPKENNFNNNYNSSYNNNNYNNNEINNKNNVNNNNNINEYSPTSEVITKIQQENDATIKTFEAKIL